MGAGEDRQADAVDVLPAAPFRRSSPGLVQTRVDDLESGVAQSASDDLCATVDRPDRAWRRGCVPGDPCDPPPITTRAATRKSPRRKVTRHGATVRRGHAPRNAGVRFSRNAVSPRGCPRRRTGSRRPRSRRARHCARRWSPPPAWRPSRGRASASGGPLRELLGPRAQPWIRGGTTRCTSPTRSASSAAMRRPP